MLGGLAKANIWVARPGGPNSSLSLPLDMLGGLVKANLKVVRPKDTSLTSTKPPAAMSMLDQKGRHAR
jgi:hypothetical protein